MLTDQTASRKSSSFRIGRVRLGVALLITAGLGTAFTSCGKDPAGSPGTPAAGGAGGTRSGGSGGASTGTGGSQPTGSGGSTPATGGVGGGTAGAPGSGGVPGGTGGAEATGGAGGSPVDVPVATGETAGEAAGPPDSSPGFRIVWVDAEGGAATLLISPTGESLLADAGWGTRDANRVAAALEKETGKKELTYFLATHYHVDHVAGAPALARAVKITNFIDHGSSVEGGGDFNTYRSAVTAAMAEARRISVTPGMKFMLGGVEITIVTSAGKVATLPTAIANPACAGTTPRTDTPDEDPQSVGFVARYGKFEFVDLGDLTAGVEHRLVCPMNQVGLVELFQSSQHGSAESNPLPLVLGFAPQVVVVNNGSGKGGDGSIFARFKTAPGMKDVWAMHKKSGQSAEQNAEDALIANLDGPDMAHTIKATAKADGTFTVTNGRTGMSKSYTSR